MKNKKTLKVLALALAFVLVIGIAVAGTVAYLTATTTAITNTFTVGKIEITLTETANLSFKIVPGSKDTKDPTITVKSGSEKCYVYACVENNLVIDSTVVGTPNIVSTDWTAIATSGNKTLYRYKEIVDAASADKALALFTEVAYSNTITESTITALDGKTIVVTAFAHQSDNVEQSAADATAKTTLGVSGT